jgi:hypothetical protein
MSGHAIGPLKVTVLPKATMSVDAGFGMTCAVRTLAVK